MRSLSEELCGGKYVGWARLLYRYIYAYIRIYSKVQIALCELPCNVFSLSYWGRTYSAAVTEMNEVECNID